MNAVSVRPLFKLGKLMATPGALALLKQVNATPIEFLLRHQSGDWGTVCGDDARANTIAVATGARLLSSYELTGLGRIWVITEADRSATTILLPSEY